MKKNREYTYTREETENRNTLAIRQLHYSLSNFQLKKFLPREVYTIIPSPPKKKKRKKKRRKTKGKLKKKKRI